MSSHLVLCHKHSTGSFQLFNLAIGDNNEPEVLGRRRQCREQVGLKQQQRWI
jgi:hypothetical protein